MEGVLQIGPLMIAADRLLAVVLLWAFLSAAALIAARRGGPVVRVAWIAATLGVLTARAGYVAQNWAAYAVEPGSILAVWQGGFLLWPGVFAAAVTVVLLLRRHRPAAGALLATLAALTAAQIGGAAALTPPPRPLPAIPMLTDMNQQPAPLTGLAGRPYALNLWATWCGPCRREMPMLLDVAAHSEVPVLLVNQGEDLARVRAYLAREGLPGQAVRLDPQSGLSAAVGSSALPTTLFIDGAGQIRQTHTGEISRAALLAALRELQGSSE